jgi:4-hydroxybenzoate polyprenyltransferase
VETIAAALIVMNEADTAAKDPGAWWPRGWRRLHVVLLCFALASVAALIVQRVVPPPATDLALMSAVWIIFYPVARLKRTEPWWTHWARGIVILIGFLLAQRYL